MKILNMNMNVAVLRCEKKDAQKCIKECFGVLSAANIMVESLKDWEQTSNVSKETYSSVQLLNAESLLESLLTPGIDMYHTGCLTVTPVLMDRLAIFKAVREQLCVILTNVVDAYIDLTDAEKTAIRELSVKILEQLTFFVFYEFNLDVTACCVQKQEELQVNEVFLDYIGKEGLLLEQQLLFLIELYRSYRPTIPSFDFSEEEIDMFYYRTGVVAHTILENIDALEPDMVRKLASGEMDPEEAIMLIRPTHKGVDKLDLFC